MIEVGKKICTLRSQDKHKKTTLKSGMWCTVHYTLRCTETKGQPTFVMWLEDTTSFMWVRLLGGIH